jgi:hypothetical protein
MSIRPRNQIRGLLLVGVGGLGNTAMNLITAIRTVIKAAAIVIFSCGVGWSMAEFDQLARKMAPTVSGNQVPPLSSCEAVFRQADLARRLGEEFAPAFITPLVWSPNADWPGPKALRQGIIERSHERSD